MFYDFETSSSTLRTGKKLKVLQNSAEDNIRIKKRPTGRRVKLFASFIEVFSTYLFLKDINW